MFDVEFLTILIPALPLGATLLTAALGKRMLREQSHVPVVASLAVAFLASIALLVQVHREASQEANTETSIGYERVATLWTWAVIERAGEANPPRQAMLRHPRPTSASK